MERRRPTRAPELEPRKALRKRWKASLPGLIEMKKKLTIAIITFFFAFLCGGVAATKVMSPSLCLRRRRKR